MPGTHAVRRAIPGGLVIGLGLAAIAYVVSTTSFASFDVGDSLWLIVMGIVGLAVVLIGWIVLRKTFELG